MGLLLVVAMDEQVQEHWSCLLVVADLIGQTYLHGITDVKQSHNKTLHLQTLPDTVACRHAVDPALLSG